MVSLFGCTSTKYSGQTPKPSELEVIEVIEIEKDSIIGSNNSRYSFKNLSPNSSYKFIDGKKLKKGFGYFVLIMGVYIILKETIL